MFVGVVALHSQSPLTNHMDTIIVHNMIPHGTTRYCTLAITRCDCKLCIGEIIVVACDARLHSAVLYPYFLFFSTPETDSSGSQEIYIISSVYLNLYEF